MPRQSEALFLLQRIRDESHRFAISFHRELRGKRMTTSVLDDIAGLGEVRRKRLIKELGGVSAVRSGVDRRPRRAVVAARHGGTRRPRGRPIQHQAASFPLMAVLRFFFGTMGSGKSTVALQIHHNLERRGLNGLLMTQLDRSSGVVSSRLGVAAEAVQVVPGMDVFELVMAQMPVEFLVCDEAQFYEPNQIDELARLVDDLGIDVYAFGLLTSFQGTLFPGTARLLEVADERQEIQVEARCWCGARATHNARLVDGEQVYDGVLKVVGNTVDLSEADQERFDLSGTPEVSYELLCRRHWLAGHHSRDSVDRAIPHRAPTPSAPDHIGGGDG